MDIAINKSYNSKLLDNIKSKYILKNIFDKLNYVKKLNIIKYNKNLQNKLNLGLNDYKDYYSKIIIEVYPKNVKEKNCFFFTVRHELKNFCHFYFNDSEKEIDRNYFTKDENISKIRIVLDPEFNIFSRLFQYCECIEKINFINWRRNDINSMDNMFYDCKLLNEINFNSFNTDNVEYMNDMFCGCYSLKELNLSKFNTSKVIIMNCMFSYCSSLKKLDLSNFNTENVWTMDNMFCGCSKLKELNISNFSSKNLVKMRLMFCGCESLRELLVNDNFYIPYDADYDDITSDSLHPVTKLVKSKFKKKMPENDSFCIII